MENCNECLKAYNPETLSIPMPIPDGMCAVCGNMLTEEEILALNERLEIVIEDNMSEPLSIEPFIDIESQ